MRYKWNTHPELRAKLVNQIDTYINQHKVSKTDAFRAIAPAWELATITVENVYYNKNKRYAPASASTPYLPSVFSNTEFTVTVPTNRVGEFVKVLRNFSGATVKF